MPKEIREVTFHPICYRSDDPMKSFMPVTMRNPPVGGEVKTRIILHELGITLHLKHIDHRQATAISDLLNESLSKVEIENIW